MVVQNAMRKLAVATTCRRGRWFGSNQPAILAAIVARDSRAGPLLDLAGRGEGGPARRPSISIDFVSVDPMMGTSRRCS